MFETTYASSVTKMGMYQRNVQTGSHTKEDLNQENSKGNTRKESNLQRDVVFKPLKWTIVPMKKKRSKSLVNLMKK
jgi:hypothetical protein